MATDRVHECWHCDAPAVTLIADVSECRHIWVCAEHAVGEQLSTAIPDRPSTHQVLRPRPSDPPSQDR